MELPIILKFDDTYLSCDNKNHEDRIRLFEIDGCYLICILTFDRLNRKILELKEIAFSSMEEAEQYMEIDLGLDLPWKDTRQGEWIDYD